MSLERPLAYFRAKQAKFAQEHHGKFVLIHEEVVVDFFENELEAYNVAKAKYPPGSFLIRRCIKPEEETPAVFHSRVGG